MPVTGPGGGVVPIAAIGAAVGEDPVASLVTALTAATAALTTATASSLRFISPSGDTTGVADTAAINAALVADQRVILRGVPGGTPFWLNAPVVMNSNNTLILWDAHLKLISGANCNIITNWWATQTSSNQGFGQTADSNIRVLGVGSAIIDGNAVNQTVPTAFWRVLGVLWINAADVRVENVTIGPCVQFAGFQVGCSKVRWVNIDLAQDRSTNNQDGIDIGPGCSDIKIHGITGTTGDDGFSIFGKYGPSGQNPAALPPWTVAAYNADPTNLTTHDIGIADVWVDFGFNALRLQAGDGASLYDVHATNINKRGPLYRSGTHAVICFGNLSFVTTPPTASQFYDITLNGFTGLADKLILADSSFKQVHVSGVHMEGTAFGALLYQDEDGLAVTVSDVTISDVTTTDTAGTTADKLMQTRTGNTFDAIKFSNIKMAQASGLLANAATVTNLNVEDVRVRTMNGPLISSTVQETGSINNVRVGSWSTTAPTRYSAASRLRFGPGMPKFLGIDTTPVATFGSEIYCSNLKDPTGGTTYTAGKFVGDGSSWNLAVALPGFTEAAPTFVKAGGSGTATTSATVTITVPSGGHTAGNMLVVGVAGAGNLTYSSVTDSRGNNYGHTTNSGSSVTVMNAYSLLGTALQAGDTITVTFTGSSAQLIADSAEWSHIVSGSTDKTASGGGSSTSLSSGTTAALTLPNELVVATFAVAASTGSFTPGSGFATLNSLPNTIQLCWMWEAVAATTAVNATATIGISHTYIAVTNTFRAGGDSTG